MITADALADGVLLDALLTFVALTRERGIDGREAMRAWERALAPSDDAEDEAAFVGDDEHIEAEIAARRLALRATQFMEEHDGEDACPAGSVGLDREAVRDGE